MPNVQQILGEEIRRLAKKEMKATADDLKAQLIALRKVVAEQGRQIKAYEKKLSCMVGKDVQEPVEEVQEEEKKSFRVTAERIRKWRQKIGISQIQFAKLLDVSHLSVNHWEAGKAEPRESMKAKIVYLRDLGKRELHQLMIEKMGAEAVASYDKARENSRRKAQRLERNNNQKESANEDEQ